MRVCQDAIQSDQRQSPAGNRLKKLSENVVGVDWIKLEENHRSPFVQAVNKVWIELNNNFKREKVAVSPKKEKKLTWVQRVVKATFNV